MSGSVTRTPDPWDTRSPRPGRPCRRSPRPGPAGRGGVPGYVKATFAVCPPPVSRTAGSHPYGAATIPKSFEYGVVPRAQSVRIEASERALARLSQNSYILRSVEAQYFGLGGRLGFNQNGLGQFKEAIGLAELKVRREPFPFSMDGPPHSHSRNTGLCIERCLHPRSFKLSSGFHIFPVPRRRQVIFPLT